MTFFSEPRLVQASAAPGMVHWTCVGLKLEHPPSACEGGTVKEQLCGDKTVVVTHCTLSDGMNRAWCITRMGNSGSCTSIY